MKCRGCGRELDPECTVADGCPCNSPRGINHGLVPEHTCTCPICDPLNRRGRYGRSPSIRRRGEIDQPFSEEGEA